VGMHNKPGNEPHAKRHGWLMNGNPQGNPATVRIATMRHVAMRSDGPIFGQSGRS
jgi:hypothetical protein